MKHMYLRYFGWNFVGVEGDWKEAGVNWKQLYGIPLLLGLFGAFYHWQKDWKMAFVATSFFLVLGLILVVYFNMQEPQPRERDYFYVGSFFMFSIHRAPLQVSKSIFFTHFPIFWRDGGAASAGNALRPLMGYFKLGHSPYIRKFPF